MSETVRVGVIGCGGIANSVHLPSLRDIEAAEIVAVCDIIEDRAQKAADEYGAPGVYTLYQQMLTAEELDAVFVLTEPDQLFRPTQNALRSGRHVFMEKPPGVTTYQAEQLARDARGADRILHVGLNRRYIPLVQRVLEIVREHTAITQVEGRFNKHTPATFYDGCMSSFRADTIHAIDAVRWIAGSEPVSAAVVTGDDGDPVTNRWNAVARFENGVTGIVRANYRTGGRVHGLEIHGPGASAFVDLGMGGPTCGAEILLHAGGKSHSLASAGTARTEQISLDGKALAAEQYGGDAFHVFYGYLQEDMDFIESIQQGRQPLTNIGEAVKAMKFVDLLLANPV
ncbi:MAG: Gfo/Idh/MocA family protein [Planctomycetota bacterium]|jgi:predicted dehydrogenase